MTTNEITAQAELAHTDEMVQYAICDNCAPVVMGYEGNEQDSDFARIMGFVEDHGMLRAGLRFDPPGYWECEACQQTCIGTGQIIEMDL